MYAVRRLGQRPAGCTLPTTASPRYVTVCVQDTSRNGLVICYERFTYETEITLAIEAL